MLRPQPQYLVVTLECLAVTTQLRKHHAAVISRIRIFGLGTQDTVVDRKRLLVSAERGERRAQARGHLGGSGFHCGRAAQQRERLAGVALLQLAQAEKMQRLELARLSGEDGAVEPLRLGKAALAVKNHRLLQRIPGIRELRRR
jgi:hypothetical protein